MRRLGERKKTHEDCERVEGAFCEGCDSACKVYEGGGIWEGPASEGVRKSMSSRRGIETHSCHCSCRPLPAP